VSETKVPSTTTSAPSEISSHGIEPTTALQPATARPGDERFLAHLATAGELVAAGRFREAEVEVLRALSGLPADLRALNLLALVRFKLGRLEEARTTYREVAVVAPNDAAARRSLGLLALKLEHLDEAIAELEMAARLAPGDQQAWSYLGYSYAKKGDTVRAAAAFRRAGQDALAVELEHAATARRPASGPKLAALAPRSGSATPPPGTPPSGPVPEVSGLHAPLVIPPPASPPRPAAAPASPPLAAAPVAPFPPAADIARAPVAAPVNGAGSALSAASAASLEPAAPDELAPLPLLGFVLARLGFSASPPPPEGQALRLGVDDEAYVRADAALAAVGVRVEPAFRRKRGRASKEPLAGAGQQFFRLVGPGDVWVAGAPGRWQALSLEDDILYVREEHVLAFDGGVSWEAGAVPGDGLRMLQFRGRGRVVLNLEAPPVAVKVTEDRPAVVGRASLLGWVGRLVTHKQRTPAPTPFELACQGEGVLLLLHGDPGRVPVPPGARSGGQSPPTLGMGRP
jgi:uncharacterized protein (AIM24 family)/tetratricopeptide (TPR) repeat protein